MPEINVRNVLVDFPYEPYDIQKDYMSKVIECLQNKQNAVLESPTGTGKTLSLLCSSLAWLRVQIAAFQMRSINNLRTQDDTFCSDLELKLDSQTGQPMKLWTSTSFRPPKLIYASRTHSQLNQVMLELKKTSYRDMKVAILGSRDQLCIHPTVTKEKNSAIKIQMCRTLIANRQCVYHSNVEKKINEPLLQDDRLVDIEDLLKKGKQLQCCPYYTTRELQKTAQVLFTPYNYLLDPKTRRAQDINLQSDVIIFDEGHNIEKLCEESASTHISSTIISICIAEVTSVMKSMCNDSEDAFVMDKTAAKDFTPEDIELLKVLLLTIEKAIDKIEIPDGKSRTFSASYIFEILSQAEISYENNNILVSVLDKVSQYLMTTSESNVHQKGAGLAKFGEFVEAAFNSLGPEKSKENTDVNYKLYVEFESVKPKGNSWSNTTPVSSGGKNLNFWCFNPGFGMMSLVNQGIHSVILTSGTLSPLEATISEIGIPVGVQLNNQHIIEPNQICAVVVEKGPGNTELRCVYQNRSNQKYLMDLGQTCLNFYRLIPGGVLVFFPSYPFLKSCIEFWKGNGVWDKMAAVKSIYVEPQNKDELKSIMEDYYTMVNARGASLLAVCRGKVSEGLDFANERARAVIVIGLPYPPFNDPKVMLKREYLDNGKRKKSSSLDGNEWYQLEAMRAVNQAVGRVIRHAGDHGAIILCDCRFSFPSNIRSLSKWLQSHLVPNLSFGQSLKLVRNFFKSWKESPACLTYNDTNSTNSSFQSSFPKTAPQFAQKLASNSCSNSSARVDYLKLYEQPSCSKNKQNSMEVKPVTSKRKSILEALDNEEKTKIVTSEESISINVGENTYLTSIDDMKTRVLKKSKLVIARPISYDNAADSQQEPRSSIIPFIKRLQRHCSSEQCQEFKEAVAAYLKGKEKKDVDMFLLACLRIIKVPDKSIVQALFKDIPHFLKTDEDKARFGDFYCKLLKK